MPKTAISDTNVPVSRGREYSDTKKIKRDGTVIEQALGWSFEIWLVKDKIGDQVVACN